MQTTFDMHRKLWAPIAQVVLKQPFPPKVTLATLLGWEYIKIQMSKGFFTKATAVL